MLTVCFCAIQILIKAEHSYKLYYSINNSNKHTNCSLAATIYNVLCRAINKTLAQSVVVTGKAVNLSNGVLSIFRYGTKFDKQWTKFK